jgi:hypothetical protein
MARTLSPEELSNLMQMAMPTTQEASRRFYHEFNTLCMQFLKRIQQWCPSAAVDAQAAINSIETASASDEYIGTPMDKFYEVTKPLGYKIAARHSSFITEDVASLSSLSMFAGITSQWESFPADTQKRVWGYIIKLFNLAYEHAKMKANMDQVLRESFQNASKMIGEFETKNGRKMTMNDLGGLM